MTYRITFSHMQAAQVYCDLHALFSTWVSSILYEIATYCSSTA